MAQETKRFVAYYRVSTNRQGQSGLGLEAQRAAVLDHLNGSSNDIIAEYTEVESGKSKDRPELTHALEACKQEKATLVIAKLDRLARNVAFIANLMEAGVEFVAVDFPQANRLTLHIMAAVAEHEREMISERTKAALAAAKKRGVKLGGPEVIKAAAASRKVRMKRAKQRAENLYPIVASVREAGITTLRGIAAALNARGVGSPSGGRWHANSVRRILASV